MPLDLTKPVQTRDGRRVKIYAMDGAPHSLIHAAKLVDGGWEAFGTDGSDLMNVPAPIDRTAWVNVYRSGAGPSDCECFKSKDLADRHASPTRIACIQIQIKGNEGDGL